MNYLDYLLVAGYVIFLVWLGLRLNRQQKTEEDYYLGGRKVRWWASGMSTMATQLSTVSFVSAPAFVAMKAVEDGGGLVWLAAEFAVPLALLFIMVVLLPVYHRAGVLSIYEYLRRRFDPATQAYISLLFQVGRGLATGVAVYAVGFVVAIFFGVTRPEQVWPYVIGIGVVTILYDALGGIRAVIWSDVIQMTILAAGIFVLAGVALQQVGGFAPLFEAYAGEAARFRIFDMRWGLGEGQDFAFWPMLLGGFFLYISYYGCDQSQVQRELSVGSIDDVKRSLLLNIYGRFPIVLLYSVMGLIVGGFARLTPEFLGSIPAEHPDWMVPLFIIGYLPHGVIGFLFIAVLAAGMSSLDSALNSMSAATMRDLYQPYVAPERSARHYLTASKLITVAWGVFTVGFALAVPFLQQNTTVLVVINKVGSMLYGPIFAAFFLGILTRWATGPAVMAGVTAGIGVNLSLWLWAPQLSWLWWNLTGFAVAVLTAAAVAQIFRGETREVALAAAQPSRLNWPLRYALVVGWFAAILLFCVWLQSALTQ